MNPSVPVAGNLGSFPVYNLHGLVLRVRADGPELLSPLHAMLHPFIQLRIADCGLKITEEVDHLNLVLTLGDVRRVVEPPLVLVWRGPLTDGPELAYYASAGRRTIVLEDLARLDVDLAFANAALVVADGQEAVVAHCLYVPILCELLAHAGRHAVHAAALADVDGRAILLAGASGRGKTTASLSLGRSGMALLSDDTCFVMSDAPESSVLVWGVRRPCRVRDKTFTLLPWLQDLPRRKAPGGGVNLVEIENLCPPSPLAARAVAIFLLEAPNPDRHQAHRADKIVACQELIRQNVHAVEPLAGGSGGGAMRAITRLVGQCDVWRLSVGPDLASLCDFVRERLTDGEKSK